MSGRGRLVVAALVFGTVAAPILAAVLVSGSAREAVAAPSAYARLAIDSALADSSAFAALPRRLRALLDVRPAIEHVATPMPLPLHECIQYRGAESGQVRRRLQLRYPDSSAVVLFAVAREEDGALERVEFIRRTPREGQRALTWEARRDLTMSVWWFEYPIGRIRREERGEIPRGSPVPRAVRALGRQLLVATCADSGATSEPTDEPPYEPTAPNSPMNPISGSSR